MWMSTQCVFSSRWRVSLTVTSVPAFPQTHSLFHPSSRVLVHRQRRAQSRQTFTFYYAPCAKCLKHPVFLREGTFEHMWYKLHACGATEAAALKSNELWNLAMSASTSHNSTGSWWRSSLLFPLFCLREFKCCRNVSLRLTGPWRHCQYLCVCFVVVSYSISLCQSRVFIHQIQCAVCSARGFGLGLVNTHDYTNDHVLSDWQLMMQIQCTPAQILSNSSFTGLWRDY